VTCISKPDPTSTHEQISHIGGMTGGQPWRLTSEEAIRRIDQKIDSFYVVDPRDHEKHPWLGVVRRVGRHPFLRTYADRDWSDNLLSLKACPAR
jgi:Protein of unknown function (DUF3892)